MRKRGYLFLFSIFLVVGLLWYLPLIVVNNQYKDAAQDENSTLYMEFTYDGFDTRYYSKERWHLAIFVQENEKPLFFDRLTYTYCDIDVDILRNIQKGERFKAYVIESDKDEYSYEIVQMEFESGQCVLSFEEYTKGHRKNAAIGFVIVPIMIVLAVALSGAMFFAYKNA